MLNKFCDSPIHKWCAFSLAFIFLSAIVLSIPAFADDVVPSPSPTPYHMRSNDPVGWKDGDTFRDILLAVSDSWGISFSKSDSSDETSILEYSDLLLEEFYADNQTTQELFWDAVKFGASETGDIILDFLGVNKIRQFANWLVDKFSLTDNSSVNTESSSSWLLIPVGTNYSTGVVISRTMYMWAHQTDTYAAHNGDIVYFASPNTAQSWNAGWYKSPNGSGTYVFTGQDSATGLWYGSYNPFNISGETGWRIPEFPTMEAFLYALNQYLYPSSSNKINLTITTTVINIPSEDLSPDEGLQIEVPGTNWGDSLYTILDLFERLIGLYDNTQLEIVSVVEVLETLMANLQRSVTVENIPGAVTLDYNEYDIPLENEWGLFDIFYNTGGDEITLLRPWQELKSIIYGFPAPVLSFFALVVLFIVAYGFIRMGRDSH